MVIGVTNLPADEPSPNTGVAHSTAPITRLELERESQEISYQLSLIQAQKLDIHDQMDEIIRRMVNRHRHLVEALLKVEEQHKTMKPCHYKKKHREIFARHHRYIEAQTRLFPKLLILLQEHDHLVWRIKQHTLSPERANEVLASMLADHDRLTAELEESQRGLIQVLIDYIVILHDHGVEIPAIFQDSMKKEA
jgi:hypothetical protein